MGLLGDIFDGVKEHNEKAQDAYEEGMRMSPQELKSALNSARNNPAKYSGYKKAAKQRGFLR